MGIHVFPIVPRWNNQSNGANGQSKTCRLDKKNFIWNFYWAEIVLMLQKKYVWQVTTIIQPALCHLGTSHIWKVLYNKTPKGPKRWLILTKKSFPNQLFHEFLVFYVPRWRALPKSPDWPFSTAVGCDVASRGSHVLVAAACTIITSGARLTAEEWTATSTPCIRHVS